MLIDYVDHLLYQTLASTHYASRQAIHIVFELLFLFPTPSSFLCILFHFVPLSWLYMYTTLSQKEGLSKFYEILNS